MLRAFCGGDTRRLDQKLQLMLCLKGFCRTFTNNHARGHCVASRRARHDRAVGDPCIAIFEILRLTQIISRVNASEPRKISPVVYPEPDEGVEMTSHLCATQRAAR